MAGAEREATPEFARLVQELLLARRLSLRALARQVPVDPGQLSRVLNGKRPPSPELARRCDAVLGAEGRVLRAAQRDRGDDVGAGNPALLRSPVGAGCSAARSPTVGTPWTSAEAITYYESLLAQHVRADNVLGPHLVLDVVEQEAGLLRAAVRGARGPARQDAVRVTCRYEEFLGWLHQDAGQLEAAMAHTDRARDLCTELGDVELTAYLLMRKSNIVTDAGDPALALALADAALAQTADLPCDVRAVVLRQKAHALAGLGDGPACAEAIGAALDAASARESEGSALAAYCTAGYVAMEAATCWLRLHRPDEAVGVFAAAPQEWPGTFRRDHGLFLARQAQAHAGVADVDTACALAGQAIRTVRKTASARTLQELGRLTGQLATWRTRPDVAAVRSAVATLVGSAV